MRGATRAEVRTKLKMLEQASAKGLKTNPRRTVANVLQAWLEEAAPKRSKVDSTNTLAGHRWAVERHLVPALGLLKLEELTREGIEGAFKTLAKGGRGTTSGKGLSDPARLQRKSPSSLAAA